MITAEELNAARARKQRSKPAAEVRLEQLNAALDDFQSAILEALDRDRPSEGASCRIGRARRRVVDVVAAIERSARQAA